MKKILMLLLGFLSCLTFGQNSISGTFEPADQFKWLLLYQLKPGSQRYVMNGGIENGKFSLQLPAGSTPGTYRLVYAVPQDEYYIDILYNGSENVVLEFDLEKGHKFVESKENILIASYFQKVSESIDELNESYSLENTNGEFLKRASALKQVQIDFEKKSAGMYAETIIKANAPYIPKTFEEKTTYHKNNHDYILNNLPMNDAFLQASGFMVDKISAYVFSSNSLSGKAEENQKNINQNIDKLAQKLMGTNERFQTFLFYRLWFHAANIPYNQSADYIYDHHLKPLAVATQNENLITEIEHHNAFRLGAKAPEVKLTEGTLSALEKAECYILVFWSSTCPHCLQELPLLMEELKNLSDTTVVAVGLEDAKDTWEKTIKRFPDFIHTIALGKWESDLAKTYAIQRTPTFFVLDKDKKFIAKPENLEELLDFLSAE
jgi:thiol-disulfide isomerase/thioredoxin